METFSIVHFTVENSVEAVPKSWYNRKKGMCAWPKLNSNPTRLIEKQVVPNEKEFSFYKARVLSEGLGKI